MTARTFLVFIVITLATTSRAFGDCPAAVPKITGAGVNLNSDGTILNIWATVATGDFLAKAWPLYIVIPAALADPNGPHQS